MKILLLISAIVEEQVCLVMSIYIYYSILIMIKSIFNFDEYIEYFQKDMIRDIDYLFY